MKGKAASQMPEPTRSGGRVRIVAGRRFRFVRHPARGVAGLAWSAYEEGDDLPFRMFQTRTRRELIEAIEAEQQLTDIPAHFRRVGI